MTAVVSAATWASLNGVGESAGSCGQGTEEEVEPAGDFGVPVFGGPFAFVGAVGDVPFDCVDEVALVAGVHFVEGAHGHRVALMSLLAMLCDLWSGLPCRDRAVWSALLLVGCLFFLIVGAILR